MPLPQQHDRTQLYYTRNGAEATSDNQVDRRDRTGRVHNHTFQIICFLKYMYMYMSCNMRGTCMHFAERSVDYLVYFLLSNMV